MFQWSWCVVQMPWIGSFTFQLNTYRELYNNSISIESPFFRYNRNIPPLQYKSYKEYAEWICDGSMLLLNFIFWIYALILARYNTLLCINNIILKSFSFAENPTGHTFCFTLNSNIKLIQQNCPYWGRGTNQQ